ncbi:MAG TPA: chromate resistance protein ChrB domain-containing protein [Solirubrobacteraceae bacterium]|jgi:hypothetical protein|nr:chromate resistance protein ChrB domain-containing protein [Solirubrobacteraceae bacterium]
MRWVTMAQIHLDRAACPWLITRFVDPEAEFEFLPWGLDGTIPEPGALPLPEGATPFAIPGVPLGLHDADGTCFSKILRAYDLRQPSLWGMERVIAAGVRHTFGRPPADDETAEEAALGAALNLIGNGLSLAYDDDGHLRAALGLYDGLHQHCLMRLLPAEVKEQAPFLPPQKIPYLREAIAAAGE